MQPYVMPVVTGVIVLGVVGWLLWHELMPYAESTRGTAPRAPAALLAAQQAAASEVDMREKTYRQAIEAGAPEAVVTVELERAIAKQHELMRLEPQVSTEQGARLARLEAERGALRARAAAARSVVLEREATAAQQAGHGAVALDMLREALQLQREANANATTPDVRSLQRETRLAQAIETTEAEPLHAVVEVSLTLAVAAAARDGWEDAIKAYTEARAAQAELNQRYPATRFADLAAPGRFDAEIASLKAAGVASIVAAREREGDAAAEAGKAQEAGTLYATAADLQADMNEKYPRSRFVSRSRVEELRAKHDNILSAAALTRAVELHRELTTALARRQGVAASAGISAAKALVEKTAAEFPRSHALDGVLRSKLAYLDLQRGDLQTWQAQIDAALVSLPGAKGWRMLKTEVPQELYTHMMNTNPSRNIGPALPVDSVSWEDAEAFCQRLTWLLGARVRLPTEAEFRAALGGATMGAWSADTSGGRSHEAGKSPSSAAGFYDLAGNLAEWLQAPSEAGGVALIAGGSYLDPADALQPLPVVRMEKRERARHIGFRVVVESPEE